MIPLETLIEAAWAEHYDVIKAVGSHRDEFESGYVYGFYEGVAQKDRELSSRLAELEGRVAQLRCALRTQADECARLRIKA
jgi:hypothetical protein